MSIPGQIERIMQAEGKLKVRTLIHTNSPLDACGAECLFVVEVRDQRNGVVSGYGWMPQKKGRLWSKTQRRAVITRSIFSQIPQRDTTQLVPVFIDWDTTNHYWDFYILSRYFDLDIKAFLTHWGRVTHICVGKLTVIGSNNGVSPGRHEAII